MNIKNKLTWIFFIVFIAVASVGLSVMAAIQLGAEETTFNQPIIVSAPSLPTHAATKGYVDSAVANIGIGGYVPTSRTISTTNGITGGGDLTANRTLSLDSTVVRTTGDQTIGGTKTFSSPVVVATPTGSTHATTKAYVDSAIANIGIGGYVPASRTIATGSGLTGGGDLTANRTLTVDSTVVRTTGDQTIGGIKTFSSAVVLSTAGTATNHAVRADRSILTGSGLTGGGNLTANRTLTVDSTVIRTTGDQTLGGTKTFSSPVVVATPTGSTHATTKAYVDSTVAG